MKTAKRTACLLAGSALAIAAMVPIAASAHTHVFLGINLGGLLAPAPVPVEVYTPPAYYVPPPPVYYTRPAYYAPRVVYTESYAPYYYQRDRDRDRHWHRGWRHDDDHGWHHRWHHHDGDDDEQ